MRYLLFLCLILSLGARAADLQTEGRDAIASGNNDAAAQAFSRALKVNPYDAVALNNLAVAKAAEGNYGEAVRLLERAQEAAPDRADISANLSRMRAWMENYGARPKTPEFAAAPPRGESLPPIPPLWRKP